MVDLKISAIICTLNRCDLLDGAVRSFARQTMASSDYEILVVDNGSTDGTRDVALRLAEEITNLRYIYEPNVGLSNARNRGIAEAQGDVVAFMDDDALADENWLQCLWSVYEKYPRCGAAGGKIELLWPTARPNWLPGALEGGYGKFDMGQEARLMAYPKYPYGSNMSIRRNVLSQCGGFATELGRKGDSLISGEEADLFRKISQSGATVIYEPRAVVHHQVLVDRLSRRWLLRRSFDGGRTSAILDRLANGSRSRSYWVGRAMAGLKSAGSQSVRMAVASLLRNHNRPALVRASRAVGRLGFAVESLKIAFTNSPGANEVPPTEATTNKRNGL